VFFMDVPHSDAPFMKAYPAEMTEAFLDGHVSAFSFFGGVPLSILYDNTKLAVARICGDGKRERTRAFSELVSHYLFRDRFGRPGKGNDKGKVEGLVKNGRRPLHYLALIEQKPGALDQARPLQGWPLPEQFDHLRRLLEARMGNRGKREFIQVLRLMEVFDKEFVAQAVKDAIRRRAVSTPLA